MRIRHAHKKGFTLIEVLISFGIMLIFLPFAANMLINNQMLASFAKHKIQAAFAAQQILETQRQNPFIQLAPGASKTIGPAAIVMDTKGNYVAATCNNPNIFCGTTSITITPAVYTNSQGVKTTNTQVNHLVVKITWIEQIANLQIPINDVYAEDIYNDPMLN